jgi:uncharacterized RDD family membrane protein YckC
MQFEEQIEGDVAERKAPAGVLKRVFALFLDGVLIWILDFSLKFILGFLGFDSWYVWSTFDRAIEVIIAIAYFTYFDSNYRYGSIGKQSVGILVVDDNDTQLTIKHSAFRAIVKVIINLFPLLWILPLFTKYRQGIHDFAAKTFVVEG